MSTEAQLERFREVGQISIDGMHMREPVDMERTSLPQTVR